MVTADAVIDIRSDQPLSSDRFFVDTNIWRFITYANFTTPHASRSKRVAQDYSKYIAQCAAAGATLHWSPLSYCELAAVIENTERDLYNANHPAANVSRKQFRVGTVERAAVLSEVKVAWSQVTGLATELPTPTGPNDFAAAMKLFEDHPLDGYDIFFINAMRVAGVTTVITDDIDFTHVNGLRVWTANDTALKQARFFSKVASSR